MQLFLILGIFFAVGAVSFAMDNDFPITVMFSNWQLESSLAVVLLLAIGLGALIAALVSTPSVIEGQWARARQRKQLASVEKEKEMLNSRLRELELEIARMSPDSAPPKEASEAYVGLKSMLLNGKNDQAIERDNVPSIMRRAGRA